MKIKQILSIIFILFNIITLLCACSSVISNSNDSSSLKLNNSYESPIESHNIYTLSSYLKISNEKPIILYKVGNIAKDAKADIYVIDNYKCRKYTSYDYKKLTLGELSKMSDEEIIKMLNTKYMENLENVLDDDIGEYFCSEIDPDSIEFEEIFDYNYMKLYKPESYEITTCLITDDSGNKVDSQLLVLPLSGVNDYINVIYYPVSSYIYSNDYYRMVTYDKFDEIFFNTNKSNIGLLNETTDCFEIKQQSAVTGAVYDSLYYGFNLTKGDYSERKGVLCFRDENAYVLDVCLDDLSNSDISIIDPTSGDLRDLAYDYYYEYYSNFSFEYFVNSFAQIYGYNSYQECYDDLQDF